MEEGWKATNRALVTTRGQNACCDLDVFTCLPTSRLSVATCCIMRRYRSFFLTCVATCYTMHMRRRFSLIYCCLMQNAQVEKSLSQDRAVPLPQTIEALEGSAYVAIETPVKTKMLSHFLEINDNDVEFFKALVSECPSVRLSGCPSVRLLCLCACTRMNSDRLESDTYVEFLGALFRESVRVRVCVCVVSSVCFSMRAFEHMCKLACLRVHANASACFLCAS